MTSELRIALDRSIQRVALVVGAAGLAVALTAPAAIAEPRLAARAVGSVVSVSFDLQSDRTDDLAQRLAAGRPVWVTFVMDVRKDVPYWIDRKTKRGELKVTARRALRSDRFVIDRTLNGRSLGAQTEASLDETYRYLTSFENVELRSAAPVSTGAQYSLAIRAVVEGGGDARFATPVLARALIER